MKTRKTMQLLIYSCLAVFMLSFAACNKDKPDLVADEAEQLPASLREVNELIRKGGKIRTLEEKRDVKLGSVEKSETEVGYQDPRGGFKRKCNSVKTTKHYSVTENLSEFVTLEPWANVFPGALIQGASLLEGSPQTIPILKKRLPGRISLSTVSENKDMDDWYREIVMTENNVQQAMDELLSDYLDANPARTSFEIKKVSSVEEMALKLGINLKLYGEKLKTEFGSGWEKDKNYVAVKLNQVFFTINYEGSDGGYAGVFTDDITARDLENFTSSGNPICYVKSVSYGRSFIILYESSADSRSLEFALNASYNSPVWGLGGDVKNLVNEVFGETTCKLLQIGGDPQTGLEEVFGDPIKLHNFIVNGVVVSKDNIGAPISYQINHLTDNSLVRLSNTLDYSVTEQHFVPVVPKNDVIIDVFNAVLSLKPAEKSYKISNFSRFELKRLAVGIQKLEDDRFNFETITPEDGKVDSKNGVNIPIYRSVVFPAVDKDARIRIKCDFYVKNQLYNGPSNIKEQVISLTQEFRYDKTKNAWLADGNTTNESQDAADAADAADAVDAAFEKLKNRSQYYPFNRLEVKEKIGEANTHFRLSYRFECDGQEYPIK